MHSWFPATKCNQGDELEKQRCPIQRYIDDEEIPKLPEDHAAHNQGTNDNGHMGNLMFRVDPADRTRE